MPLQQSQQVVGFTARALSASGTTQSPAMDCGGAVDWVSINVNVTAAGGTSPNLTLSVQWSQDQGTTWADADTADSFTALTAVSNVVKRFPVKGQKFRLKEVFTGTNPTATYTCNALIG